jgi:hypothetical protein
MGKYICPICGYPNLLEPPCDPSGAASFEICPCCGGELGYNNATIKGLEIYRNQWLATGAHWFDESLRPVNWDIQKQLSNIGIDLGQT